MSRFSVSDDAASANSVDALARRAMRAAYAPPAELMTRALVTDDLDTLRDVWFSRDSPRYPIDDARHYVATYASDTEFTLLVSAVTMSAVRCVAFLVEQGASVNYETSQGTALEIGARHQAARGIVALIRACIDIERPLVCSTRCWPALVKVLRQVRIESLSIEYETLLRWLAFYAIYDDYSVMLAAYSACVEELFQEAAAANGAVDYEALVREDASSAAWRVKADVLSVVLSAHNAASLSTRVQLRDTAPARSRDSDVRGGSSSKRTRRSDDGGGAQKRHVNPAMQGAEQTMRQTLRAAVHTRLSEVWRVAVHFHAFAALAVLLGEMRDGAVDRLGVVDVSAVYRAAISQPRYTREVRACILECLRGHGQKVRNVLQRVQNAAIDREGECTVLHAACLTNDAEVVWYAVGAAVQTTTRQALIDALRNPYILDAAVNNEASDVVRVLYERLEPNIASVYLNAAEGAHELSIEDGEWKKASTMVEMLPMKKAADMGDVKMVTTLVDYALAAVPLTGMDTRASAVAYTFTSQTYMYYYQHQQQSMTERAFSVLGYALLHRYVGARAVRLMLSRLRFYRNTRVAAAMGLNLPEFLRQNDTTMLRRPPSAALRGAASLETDESLPYVRHGAMYAARYALAYFVLVAREQTLSGMRAARANMADGDDASVLAPAMATVAINSLLAEKRHYWIELAREVFEKPGDFMRSRQPELQKRVERALVDEHARRMAEDDDDSRRREARMHLPPSHDLYAYCTFAVDIEPESMRRFFEDTGLTEQNAVAFAITTKRTRQE